MPAAKVLAATGRKRRSAKVRMITYFVAFLVSLMVGTVLTLVVRNRAVAYGWLDQAKSSRKIHLRPIPRLGGIAIVGGFFAPLCALALVDSGVGDTFFFQRDLVQGVFCGGLAIVALGLYDDLRGAGAKLKFGVQIAVAVGLYLIGFRIEVIANPFGAPLTLGWLALPFTTLWLVGVVNAMNLIDGLDGLAGGVAFFAVGTNFVLALARGDVLLCLLMAALAGAVLGFLIFNFNPASIFMGDTGSMFLGFVLGAVSIRTSAKSGTAVAMLVPIIALGLPIMDTLLSIIRRTLLGRPLFSADKEHIHHRVMSRMLLSHRHAVLVLYGLCCLFALTALGLSFANSAQSAMLLVGVGVVVIVLMRKLGYLNLRGAATVSGMRRRNIHLRALVRQVVDGLAASRDLTQCWEGIRPLGEELGCHQLKLTLERTTDVLRDGITFETTREAGAALPFEVVLPVMHGPSRLGTLLLVWRDGRSEIDRDEELALELVTDAVARAEARFLSQAAETRRDGKVVALRK